MSPSGRFERSQGADLVTHLHGGSGEAADPALLQKVLQQTLAAMTATQRIAPAEMAALQAIARRHHGAQLDEAIATELVQAVLCGQGDYPDKPPPIWRTTSQRVAQLLLDDPEASERLHRMWMELMGSSS